MSKTLEARVDALEREIAELRKLTLIGVDVPSKDAWLTTCGWAKDDPYYEEAMRLGAEWRREENRRSIEEFDARSRERSFL